MSAKVSNEALSAIRNQSQYGSPESPVEGLLDFDSAFEDVSQEHKKLEDTESIVPPGSLCRVWFSGAAYTFVGANEQGDGAVGVITDHGSSVTISEKGVVGIKAGAPVKEDLSMGNLEIVSEHATRLKVGTNFSIEVNASGKHEEDGEMTNSLDQSKDKKSQPAFSINVSKGGLNITCEDGNITFMGKNILFNAGENIQMTANRSISILAGYNPSRESMGVIGNLFGFDLPAASGGDVIIKAGNYILDTNKVSSTSSAREEKTGGAKSTEVGSTQGVDSYDSAGDLNLSSSGFVRVAAGQKLRIEAQNSPTNLAGIPSVPPIWATTQIPGMEISVNNKSGIVGLPALSIKVDNGDFLTNVTNTGNYSVTTSTGSISMVTGNKSGIISTNPGDIFFESKIGNFTGKSKLVSGLWGVTEAGVAIGEVGKATDAIHVFNASVNGDIPGAVMRSTKGIAAVLGVKQVGMGIGKTPQSSQNYIALNPSGLISKINGPYTQTITGATTIKVTGVYTVTASTIFLN
jgi:hypothetical protein